ncbi:MAG: oligosaccharide flippase family protein [Planctomycetes bacterium]|nr:oligosaccharide flippase family protein [Planctomycetota bacterium]
MPSLARNTAWLTLAKTISVSIYALFGLVLPRLVSAAENGVYTLMSTLLFFGGLAASFGVPVILIRNIARDRSLAGQIYVDARRAMIAGAVLSAVFVLVYLLAEMALQGSFDPARLLLSLFVVALLFVDALASLSESMFQAHERMVFPARVEVLTGLVRGGGALLSLLFLPGAGLFGVFACFLAGSSVRALILVRAARRRYLTAADLPEPDWRRTLALVRESFGVALFRVMRMVRNRADSLLLGIVIVPAAGLGLMEAADSARGLYGQAMRVIFVFHTFTMALNTAIFPRMARLTADPNGQGEARRQFGRVVRYQAWWSCLLAVLVFQYSDELAGWFGPAYLNGIEGIVGTTGQALRILVVAVLIDSVAGPVGMVMVGRPEMDRMLPIFGGSLATVSIVLNLALIPRYGVLGAAYASLGASIVEFGLKVYFMKILLGSARSLLGVLPHLALAGAIALGLHGSPLAARPLLGGAAALAVYLLVGLALGLVDPALTRRLSSALGRGGRPRS